jgi:tubulin--tyrosine ligase-like protein 12
MKKAGIYMNQFPFEACLVMKNNLANTVQSTLGNTNFLQRTYDL